MLLWLLMITSSPLFAFGFDWPTLTYSFPCSKEGSVFDTNTFGCRQCEENSEPRGYFCECKSGFRKVKDTGAYGQLECDACPEGTVPSSDGLNCRPCEKEIDKTNHRCPCASDEILVERNLNGTLMSSFKCVKCEEGSFPSDDGNKCVSCRSFPLIPHSKCNCTSNNRLCYQDRAKGHVTSLEDGRGEVVYYDKKEIRSYLFKKKLKESVYLCEEFNSVKACQILGNLCVLALHDRNHPACRIIYDLKRSRSHDVPQLYFVNRPDKKKDITNIYRPTGPGSRLKIAVVEYDLNGNFLGLKDSISGTNFNFCNGSFSKFDAAFDFGTKFHTKCSISPELLWNRLGKDGREGRFYDLYISYNSTLMDSENTKLFALPFLIKNIEQNKNEDDDHNWQFTTRFFMIDRIGGQSSESGENSTPEAIRYLSKFRLRIQLLNTREFPKQSGMIYPPVVEIEYGVMTKEDYKESLKPEKTRDKKYSFEFSVEYEMDNRESIKDIEIAVGVLSAIAVFWSIVETWTWSRRSGKLTLDPYALGQFLANAAGNLSHIFFVVIYFASLYYMIFFKQQNYIHVILPNADQEKIIKNFVYSIFALKIIDIVHLIYQQVTVDIFLMDWEKPQMSQEKIKDPSVSVWRTYLVANEWNELQVQRKISVSLQVFLVLLVLKVIGVENVATSDPHSAFTLSDDSYHSSFSYVCRFALGVTVYGSASLLQVVFWRGIYTSLIEDKLEQFLDVCSLANISVFVMSLKNFGYYIHGKSAHGVSDTDMARMLEHLQRETEDLCGHRGLQPGSDHQAFTMTLPSKLRQYYDAVVLPAASSGSFLAEMAPPRNGSTQKLISGGIAGLVKAYDTMNKFLTRFLEHALRDMDYEIRDRMFVETVLGTEFQDTSDKAVFYTDKCNSFSDLLLHGHELSLGIFDLTIFSLTDLVAQNFLLAGIVTYFVAKTIMFIRFVLGRRNLARKTLIDQRFLL